MENTLKKPNHANQQQHQPRKGKKMDTNAVKHFPKTYLLGKGAAAYILCGGCGAGFLVHATEEDRWLVEEDETKLVEHFGGKISTWERSLLPRKDNVYRDNKK